MFRDIGIGTFQAYYEADLLKEYSASTIAWIPSLQIFFMYVMVSDKTLQQLPISPTSSLNGSLHDRGQFRVTCSTTTDLASFS